MEISKSKYELIMKAIQFNDKSKKKCAIIKS